MKLYILLLSFFMVACYAMENNNKNIHADRFKSLVGLVGASFSYLAHQVSPFSSEHSKQFSQEKLQLFRQAWHIQHYSDTQPLVYDNFFESDDEV